MEVSFVEGLVDLGLFMALWLPKIFSGLVKKIEKGQINCKVFSPSFFILQCVDKITVAILHRLFCDQVAFHARRVKFAFQKIGN